MDKQNIEGGTVHEKEPNTPEVNQEAELFPATRTDRSAEREAEESKSMLCVTRVLMAGTKKSENM